MTAPKKSYDHAAEAASRRAALSDALEDQQQALQQLEEARDASREVAQGIGTGGVDVDQLLRVRAQLEIAEARAARTGHQVRLSRSRLLNESVDIAERLVPAVLSMITGLKHVDVLAHEPKGTPEGKLPAAAVVQLRESLSHPSGYLYTHSNGYNGARSVEIHLWTVEGRHVIPTLEQVARGCRTVQVSTGSRGGAEPVLVSTTHAGEITHSVFSLKVVSSWPEVPTVDLSSPWFNPAQEMDVPVRHALAAPGLPSAVSHASVHSRILSSTVDKLGVRSTRVELRIAGASTAFPVATTTGAIQGLARAQIGRAHAWLGRCTGAEITRTVAVDAQGQPLEAGRTMGTAAGALVVGLLEFTSHVPK